MDELRIPGSIAASGVATAALRAHEGTREDALFDDPLARLLVSRAQDVAEDHRSYLADGAATTSPLTRMMGDYLSVRTHVFDVHLLATAQAGARQVVLLGSGLDVRAHRLRWPRATRIFEVDVPEVHAFKDELLAQTPLAPTAERVTIGAGATEDWRSLVEAAGFDDARPTSWLAEGLLFYLDRGACDELVRSVLTTRAPVTWLAGDYATTSPRERAAFAVRHRVDDDGDPQGEDVIDAGLLPFTRSGPGVAPARWLPPPLWEVTGSTFAQQGARLHRSVPAWWDPDRGGETMWMFHAEHLAG